MTSRRHLCQRCWDSERQICYARMFLACHQLARRPRSASGGLRYRRLMLIIAILRHHPMLGPKLVSALFRRRKQRLSIGHVLTDEPIYSIAR
jgi:hypothetical protein